MTVVIAAEDGGLLFATLASLLHINDYYYVKIKIIFLLQFTIIHLNSKHTQSKRTTVAMHRQH